MPDISDNKDTREESNEDSFFNFDEGGYNSIEFVSQWVDSIVFWNSGVVDDMICIVFFDPFATDSPKNFGGFGPLIFGGVSEEDIRKFVYSRSKGSHYYHNWAFGKQKGLGGEDEEDKGETQKKPSIETISNKDKTKENKQEKKFPIGNINDLKKMLSDLKEEIKFSDLNEEQLTEILTVVNKEESFLSQAIDYETFLKEGGKGKFHVAKFIFRDFEQLMGISIEDKAKFALLSQVGIGPADWNSMVFWYKNFLDVFQLETNISTRAIVKKLFRSKTAQKGFYVRRIRITQKQIVKKTAGAITRISPQAATKIARKKALGRVVQRTAFAKSPLLKSSGKYVFESTQAFKRSFKKINKEASVGMVNKNFNKVNLKTMGWKQQYVGAPLRKTAKTALKFGRSFFKPVSLAINIGVSIVIKAFTAAQRTPAAQIPSSDKPDYDELKQKLAAFKISKEDVSKKAQEFKTFKNQEKILKDIQENK